MRSPCYRGHRQDPADERSHGRSSPALPHAGRAGSKPCREDCARAADAARWRASAAPARCLRRSALAGIRSPPDGRAPWRVRARSPAPADSGALHRPPPPAGAGERPPAASRRSGLPWHNPGSGAVGAAIYRVATAPRNTNCRGPRARNERHDCNQHLCHGPRRAAAPCAQLWAANRDRPADGLSAGTCAHRR